MKNKILKILLVSLFAFLVLFSLSACSNGDKGGSGDKYTVTYNLDGGSGAFGEQKAEYGKKFKLPSGEPVKDGYVFDGWYYNNLKATDTIWRYKTNVEFKAKWNAIFKISDSGEIEGNDGVFEQLETITIPSSFEGKTVTGIGKFSSETLKYVYFAENCAPTYIGFAAFSGCSSLNKFIVPKTVNIILDNAFYDCVSLENLEFEEGSVLENLGDAVFVSCKKIETIVLPKKLNAIPSGSFANCQSLKTIIFEEGANISQIGSLAFQGCTALRIAEIPASVTSMQEEVFKDCDEQLAIYTTVSTRPSGWHSNFNSGLSVYFGCEVQNKTLSERKVYATGEILQFNLADYDLQGSSVKFVLYGDNCPEYTELNSIVRIPCAKMQKGEHDLTLLVVNNGKNLLLTVSGYKAVDMKLGSMNDLETFIEKIQESGEGSLIEYYAVLTNDIDCNNGMNFATRNGTYYGYFAGELDGQGYSIKNFTSGKNGMFWAIWGATIKNIGFVNVKTMESDDHRAILYWKTNGRNVFENVYLDGYVTACKKDGGVACGFGNSAGTLTLNNVMIDIEFNEDNKYYAVARGGQFAGEHVYAVSQTAKGISAGVSGPTYKLCRTETELASVISSESLATFSSEFWDTSSGIPKWKHA